MDDMWVSIWRGLKAVFSDPSFLQILTTVASLLVITFVKRVRDFIARMCQKLIKVLSDKHHLDAKHMKQYDAIGDDLFSLRLFADAARVAVYQFHNGDEFTLSNPIFKVTCSHERVRNGLTFDADIIKFMLVSNFMDLVGPLMDPSRNTAGVTSIDACEKVDDIKACNIIGLPLRILKYQVKDMPYSQFKYVMESQGVTVLYATLLYSKDRNHPIGILGIQYQDDAVHDSFIKDNICAICDITMRVQFLLDAAK